MGSCYDVNLKLSFRDKEKDINRATKAMQEYIKFHDGKDTDFNIEKWEKEGITQNSFQELLHIFLCGWACCNMDIKQEKKWLKCYNHFNASYGWERIMLDMFDIITPFLADNSEMHIYIDNDYDHLVVKNGKCVRLH